MTILVALGSNLPAPDLRSSLETLHAAIERLRGVRISIQQQSHFYTSPAWPPSDQPDYINAVVAVATKLSPAELLGELLRIEREFGRARSVPNAARTLDLDLIAYHDVVTAATDGALVLPHPRLASRAFVLLPLCDVAPDWRHPVSGRSVGELLAAIDTTGVRPIEA